MSRSPEQAKSEDSDGLITTVKAKLCRINIHMRKDVINKTIIRAFNRYYVKCFKPKLNFEGHTMNSLYRTLYQKVNQKFTLYAIYQEYFSLVDDTDNESKL